MANAPHKFKNGVAISGTAEVNSDAIVTETATQTITGKTIDGGNNTIQNIPSSALSANVDAAKIADGSVSNAEFQHINSLTSNAQDQIDAKAASSDLASTANGAGASLVGIEDSAAQFTATDVEGALTESLDAAQAAQADATQALSDASAAQSTADAALPKAGGTMSGAIAMGANKITGMANGTALTDAATFGQLQSVTAGIDLKESVRLATNAALPAYTASGGPGVGRALTADAVGILTVDGVATVLGDRIIVKDEGASDVDHGIYEVTTEGTAGVAFVLTRATDADEDAEVTSGMFAFVQEGTQNANTGWAVITSDPITVDTTPIQFSQFQGLPSYTASLGVDLVGVDFRLADAVENASGIKVLNGAITLEDLGAFDTDDLIEGVNKYATQAQLDKVDFLTVTQAVDLDTIESDLAAHLNGGANKHDASEVDYERLDASKKNIQAASDDIESAVTDLDDAIGALAASPTNYAPTDASIVADHLAALDIAVGTASGANVQLSNLGTTDLQDVDLNGVGNIIPDANNANNLGNATNAWGIGNIVNLNHTTDNNLALQFATAGQITLNKNIVPFANDTSAIGSAANNMSVIHARDIQSNTTLDLISGNATISANSSKIISVVDPTADQDAATKKYVDDEIAGIADPGASAGDITETSFSAANNQATPANVTGLSFAAGTVRSAKVLASVEIDATADLYESYELLIIQKGADFQMAASSVGDNSNVNFSITPAGQVQYTSGNEAGFVSSDIKFRAITLTV